ncbi:hypothetical protein E1298_05680 [Actinomadura rubrisoli]|uniref:Uncharacterized protein n=1 Tax=Actinomadura rubrisoli TaxID=2530368 RepID=A0A4R5CAB4_9ACTN|nr:hypothetical protein E1298_05680 [Actinomadura rubrisoli]
MDLGDPQWNRSNQPWSTLYYKDAYPPIVVADGDGVGVPEGHTPVEQLPREVRDAGVHAALVGEADEARAEGPRLAACHALGQRRGTGGPLGADALLENLQDAREPDVPRLGDRLGDVRHDRIQPAQVAVQPVAVAGAAAVPQLMQAGEPPRDLGRGVMLGEPAPFVPLGLLERRDAGLPAVPVGTRQPPGPAQQWICATLATGNGPGRVPALATTRGRSS